jgi:hypothetical protein
MAGRAQPRATAAGQSAAPGSAAPRSHSALKRTALLVAMTAVLLNVWTGSPLLALWIGSRLQGTSGAPQMFPVFVVAISIGVFSFVLLRVLRRLGGAYDDMTGRAPTIRAHVPWLRSLRGERPFEAGEDYSLSALDILVCAMVIVALVAFEYWFFFESGSSIDMRSGR